MTMTWGTITDTSPLRVTLDGDSAELPFTPDSLVDPLALAVNDRVRCDLTGRRVVIVGRSGGDFDPSRITELENTRQIQTFVWANAAARNAQTGMVAGDQGYQTDTGISYRYSGIAWLPAHSGAIAIRVVRASNTPALSTAFVDLSTNANWSRTTPAAQNRGFATYSNGITVPFTGVYRVGYSLASAGAIAFLAGVTVNKSSGVAFTDFEVISTAAVAQGVASTSASEELYLAASSVLRLYAIATSGTPSLSASVGSFYCEWIRP